MAVLVEALLSPEVTGVAAGVAGAVAAEVVAFCAADCSVAAGCWTPTAADCVGVRRDCWISKRPASPAVLETADC